MFMFCPSVAEGGGDGGSAAWGIGQSATSLTGREEGRGREARRAASELRRHRAGLATQELSILTGTVPGNDVRQGPLAASRLQQATRGTSAQNEADYLENKIWKRAALRLQRNLAQLRQVTSEAGHGIPNGARVVGETLLEGWMSRPWWTRIPHIHPNGKR
ncbi:hypothetical protein BT67DRAFT_141378 [Trichocladium antarcticum]|uniref:Uncharacterized protein n=1 Tax=Trichocladium antarcticum TaxID=1450529 RepID=A0AAN6UFE9_9PEZI|nr:hypothetical protein BT67DRAFT_141378 [Trichocladium antarcticum]